MVNEFTREPVAEVPKTRFHFTPTHDTTGQFFMLMPTFCKQLVPGDIIKSFNTSCFGRAISLEAPVLNKIRIRHDLFFVSYNSMDSEFKHFLPRVSPDASTSTQPNDISFLCLSDVIDDTNDGILNTFAKTGQLADRLGFHYYKSVTSISDLTQDDYDNFNIDSQIFAYPFVAYHRICDKYFTNYDLQDNKYLDLDMRDYDTNGNGFSAQEFLSCRYSNWSYDYYLSALPWVQRFPSPEINLQNAFIKSESWSSGSGGAFQLTGNAFVKDSNGNYKQVRAHNGTTPTNDFTLEANDSTVLIPDNSTFKVDSTLNFSEFLSKAQGYHLTADISGTSVTMTDLRDSMLLQMMLEAQARGGSRYDELSLTMYGIAPSNEVLHEPLWLGGYTQNLMTSEVVSTSSNSDNSGYLGNLAGHGITSDNGNMIHSDFECKEFGVLMQITRIYPEQIYSQGVPREFIYTDYFGSIFNPMFNNMSNQPVYNAELFNNGVKVDIEDSNDFFGYNGIYDFMRTMENSVSGDLRNNNLKYWLATREFSETPQLNASFINGKNSISSLNNIFSVTDADPFILHFDFDINMLRPIPAVAVPAFTV